MRVAVLGTGLMGAPLAQRALAAGLAVAVWNRTPERAEGLVGMGAVCAATPAEAIADAEIVLCMLADAVALNDVLDQIFASCGSGSRTGAQVFDGKVCVQMGTIAPSESRALAARVRAAGGDYVEAPVLGSIPEARSGRLIVMVGADDEAPFERVQPLLRCFGEDPTWAGAIGQAAAMKLAFNQLIASLTQAFALSRAYLEAESVPLDDFMPLLRASALYAPTFDKKLERMQQRDFSRPNFPLKHLLKDVRLFEQAASETGVDADCLAPVAAHIKRVIAAGHGDDDYSALSLQLKR